MSEILLRQMNCIFYGPFLSFAKFTKMRNSVRGQIIEANETTEPWTLDPSNGPIPATHLVIREGSQRFTNGPSKYSLRQKPEDQYW